ncbi:MAG: NUDIX domain-containing protein [Candidatus Woesearchaeota archaeon]
MDEKYSIKDGRIEAVMWIVYKDNKIIIEKRPKSEAGEMICIPCGHIDLLRDKTKDRNDYVQSAFLRESQEEFKHGNFKPTQYQFFKSVDYDELNKKGDVVKLRLHYFLVSKWDGHVPKYTIEDEKKHAKLEWFSILDYKKLPQSCDRDVLELLLKNPPSSFTNVKS